MMMMMMLLLLNKKQEKNVNCEILRCVKKCIKWNRSYYKIFDIIERLDRHFIYNKYGVPEKLIMKSAYNCLQTQFKNNTINNDIECPNSRLRFELKKSEKNKFFLIKTFLAFSNAFCRIKRTSSA